MEISSWGPLRHINPNSLQSCQICSQMQSLPYLKTCSNKSKKISNKHVGEAMEYFVQYWVEKEIYI